MHKKTTSGPRPRPSIIEEPSNPKLCLRCARAVLAGKRRPFCADCPLLNIDRLAHLRLKADKPFPFLIDDDLSPPSRPAQATTRGRRW